ncbi:MAG: ABC transporter permease, partial [Acidobacteria bacterium]|nr:ABC transporter permease [Acidobacteriota bacterium]
AIFITVYLIEQTGFDTNHLDYRNKFRINNQVSIQDKTAKLATTSPNAGPVYKSIFPEIKDFVRIQDLGNDIAIKVSVNEEIKGNRMLLADSNFFNFFSFDLLSGDKNTILQDPNSVVITDSLAGKLFADTDALGQSLQIGDSKYKITGIVKLEKKESHIQFDLLGNLTYRLKDINNDDWMQSMDYYTYFHLMSYVDSDSLSERMIDYTMKKLDPVIKAMGIGSVTMKTTLQPINKIHFNTDFVNELATGIDSKFLVSLLVIALLILFIVSFNYINLSIASHIKRAKEIGIKKIAGASKKQIIKEFVIEALIQNLLALIIAILLIMMLTPAVNSYFGVELDAIQFFRIDAIVFTLVLFSLVTLMSSIQPAVFISRLNPAILVKEDIFNSVSKPRIRKTLVTTQFIIGVILITSTLFIHMQVKYMKEKDVGFERNGKLAIRLDNNSTESKARVLKNELENIPGIKRTSLTHRVPGGLTNIKEIFYLDGYPDSNFSFDTYWSDENFAQTLGIEIIEGRPLRETGDDGVIETLISQHGAQVLGIKKPIDTIIWNREIDGQATRHRIVGVFRDFHSDSMHTKIWPTLIKYHLNNGGSWLLLSTDGKNMEKVLSDVRDDYAAIFPDKTMEYYFLNDLFSGFYQSEERLNRITVFSTGFAIFLSCIGLFGLVIYHIKEKTKEIGIRKVLGAQVIEILGFMYRDYLKIIVISLLIGWPLAYLWVHDWLGRFAYRMAIDYRLFIISGVLLSLFAMLTISYHSVKASLLNPIDTLRHN